MSSELGILLGQSLKSQKDSSSIQGMTPDAISSYFVFSDYQFKIKVTKVLIEEQSIAGDALIWGNSTIGIWGTGEWADDSVFAFTLGHETAGVLGTSTLGGTLNPFETVEEIILTQSIPDIARREIIKWLSNESAKNLAYLSIGSGSTPYSSINEELETEITRKVITVDISESLKAQYILEISTADTEFQGTTIKEIGLNSDATNNPADILYTRALISDLDITNIKNYKITVNHEYEDLSLGDSLMTNVGLNTIREFVSTGSDSSPSHAIWGDGTLPLVPTDIVLEGEVERNAIASIINNGFTTSYDSILDNTEANGTNITKAGLINAPSLGDLFAETLFGAINKTNLFQVQQTDRITIL